MESTQETVRQITLAGNESAMKLFGKGGENVRRFEKSLGVGIDTRGATIIIRGDAEASAFAERLLLQVYGLIEHGYDFTARDLEPAVKVLRAGEKVTLSEVFLDTVLVSHKKQRISPKGVTQKLYLDAIRTHDIVFGIGPAGTGKTYLAMAAAVRALSEKKIDRIILTRPAVEAGEKLGFLPGDMAAKVDPYLRPLYDALHDMMDYDQAQRLIERGGIEVAPLAFMRGRTLNDSFVILDEAQNTTVEQIKMFLTRLGFGSKAVVTGDVTQIDLPADKSSGLVATRDILKNIDGIKFINFTDKDVVRHPLVQEVIRAFERVEGDKTRR